MWYPRHIKHLTRRGSHPTVPLVAMVTRRSRSVELQTKSWLADGVSRLPRRERLVYRQRSTDLFTGVPVPAEVYWRVRYDAAVGLVTSTDRIDYWSRNNVCLDSEDHSS